METGSSKLTKAQEDQVVEAMKENLEESESLKAVAELPSNNGVEEATDKQEGYAGTVSVSVDAATGERKPTFEKEEENPLNALDFDEMVKRAEENLGESEKNVEITEDDIADQISKDNEYFKDMDLTSEEIMQILRVVQRVQKGEDVKVFREFPQKVQDALNKYLSRQGIVGYSAQANQMRNALGDIIASEFITNISLDKYTMDFQKEMNALQNKVDTELSKMWKDYTSERDKYVRAIMEEEQDESKKKAIGAILDAINDGFALERIKKAAGGIRVKKIEMEKTKRAFDIIHNKYQDSTYNIYSVNRACEILQRHMQGIVDPKDVLKFFIVICKFCMNYKVSNPAEHAFMYYAMYNPILLEVYKDEEYKEFFDSYTKNVLDVIDIINRKSDNK